MPQFARGPGRSRREPYWVWGDTPVTGLPEMVRESLAGLSAGALAVETHADVLQQLRGWLAGALGRLRRVPVGNRGMLLAAELREGPWASPACRWRRPCRFATKKQMKRVLDAAGVRTPRHVACTSSSACWEGRRAHWLFPIIIKADRRGAGSADTYRVNSADELRDVLPRMAHVPTVSVRGVCRR